MYENIIEVSESNFQSEVLNSDKPVLVDFWAAWCGPCRMVSPVIDELAKQYSGKVKVVKVNVDDNPVIAGKYEIMSIPSVFLFKNGQKVDALVGARPKQSFEQMIQGHI